MGHRIAKHVYNNETNMLEKSTYYILDAQGNQMSMYEHVPLETTVEYNLVERNIYGSSRVGTFTEKINVLTATYQYSNISQSLGSKFYEFTNHLGNVLSVFSDTKIPLDGDSDGTVDGYSIQIVSTADYSPFGVQLDGRSVESEIYRYGFQNQEKDDEVSGKGNSYTAEFWQYDCRAGRRWNIDPVFKEHESPYACFANNPIWFSDPNGADSTISNFNSSWKWTVEEGDTYESISKRTNVKESKLRRLNKNQNLEVGDVIKLSNKKGEINFYPGNEVKTSQGNVYLDYNAVNTNNPGHSGVQYIICFQPIDKDCEYLIYQTVASNFPKETEVWQENDNARADDKIAGMEYGNDIVKGYIEAGGEYSFHKGIYTHDAPARPFLKGKTNKWRANIQIIEKHNESYIVIATFQMSFIMHDSKLVDAKFRVNPNLSDEDKEYQKNAIKNTLKLTPQN